MKIRRPQLTFALLLAAVAVLGRPWRLGAQVEADSSRTAKSGQRSTPSATVSADSCTRLLERVRRDPNAARSIRAAQDFIRGQHDVPAGARVEQVVVTCGGNLDVYGTVHGDAIALDGDVVVHDGGEVTGNALAVRGRIRVEGGRVAGEMRTLRGTVGELPRRAQARPLTPAQATVRALKIVLGWLAMALVIGIGVLMFGGTYLEGVVVTMERNFSKAFWTGLVGQFALLPALLILVVGFALTILGILLIPFAIVAFALAACGLLALGFLAAAQVTGGALRKPGGRLISARGAALGAILTGIAVYMGLWVLAAAFTWSTYAGAVLRVIALAATWVATTTGFGAALLSRAGSRRVGAAASGPAISAPKEDDAFAWQTPTPVSGVVAARRPTPAVSSIKDLK